MMADDDTINCSTHGKQPFCLVCIHLIEKVFPADEIVQMTHPGEGIPDDWACKACADAVEAAGGDEEVLGPGRLDTVRPGCLPCCEKLLARSGIRKDPLTGNWFSRETH